MRILTDKELQHFDVYISGGMRPDPTPGALALMMVGVSTYVFASIVYGQTIPGAIYCVALTILSMYV